MRKRIFTELNWHPMSSNPLDYVRRPDLETYTEHKVQLVFDERGNFAVRIGSNDMVVTGDNISTCYFLNSKQVGVASYVE